MHRLSSSSFISRSVSCDPRFAASRTFQVEVIAARYIYIYRWFFLTVTAGEPQSPRSEVSLKPLRRVALLSLNVRVTSLFVFATEQSRPMGPPSEGVTGGKLLDGLSCMTPARVFYKGVLQECQTMELPVGFLCCACAFAAVFG